MILADFETLVCEYISRDATALGVGVGGGVLDKVMIAANEAKAWAQRVWKFEHARRSAQLIVVPAGTLLSAATPVGGGAPIQVRNIIEAFLTSPDLGSLYPIRVISRGTQVERIRQKIDNVAPYSLSTTLFDTPLAERYLVQNGNTVFLWPYNQSLMGAAATVTMDITEFLPEYSATVTNDFFITECLDWMKLRTIKQLNLYLKDDDKYLVSTTELREAWEAVKAWDTSFVEGSVPVEID